jgi:hypothetical protein
MSEQGSKVWLADRDDGPGGALGDLPPPETRRWVARRKAQVVAAVRAGLLTLEEAAGATTYRSRSSRRGSARSTGTESGRCG